MTNWLDIFPHCQPCGADWKDGACPECGEKLQDLIDNYDGADDFNAYHYGSDTPTWKQRKTMKQEF